MAVTVSDVEALSAKGWQHLDDAGGGKTQKQALLDRAERFVNTTMSDRVATLPEIEGDRDDLISLVAAHHFELASGGEAQSESSTGGSVNYNTVTGEVMNGLSETRYGRMALEYVRDEQGISMVRTR